MTKFFIDLHPVNQRNFDFSKCKPLGITGVAVKAAEGEGISYGQDFHNMVELVKAHDLDLFAYFWLHSGTEAYHGRQVDNLLNALGERALPIAVDVERSKVDSPKWPDLVTFAQILESHGRDLTGTYLPRWYHDEIGGPNLTAAFLEKVALWNSAYGPDVTASPQQAFAANIRDSAWDDIGGKAVDAVQFGQHVMVGEWKVDCSAAVDDAAYDKVFGIVNRKDNVALARDQLVLARGALRVAETKLESAASHGRQVAASQENVKEARTAVRDAIRALPDR